MGIRRVVPDIQTKNLDESRKFYVEFLGFELAMELGFVMTFVSPSNPTAQVTVFPEGRPPQPNITVEVGDVHAVHSRAVETNGMVINVMSHRSTSA